MLNLERIIESLDDAVSAALDAATTSSEGLHAQSVTRAILEGVQALHYAQNVAVSHQAALAVIPTEV